MYYVYVCIGTCSFRLYFPHRQTNICSFVSSLFEYIAGIHQSLSPETIRYDDWLVLGVRIATSIPYGFSLCANVDLSKCCRSNDETEFINAMETPNSYIRMHVYMYLLIDVVLLRLIYFLLYNLYKAFTKNTYVISINNVIQRISSRYFFVKSKNFIFCFTPTCHYVFTSKTI